MKKLVLIFSIALLIVGQTYLLQNNGALSCEEDDLIELHSDVVVCIFI